MRKRKARRMDEVEKPAFALGEEPGLAEGEQPRLKEARMELRDRLDEGAFAKLKQLKSQMSETATTTVAGGGAKQRKQRPAGLTEQDEEASFADLLNPKDDPDESFEDMLARSKLDWKGFK